MRRLAVHLVPALLAFLVIAGEAKADADEQKVAFNTHCRNCHSFKQGDNRLGPSMYGIIGAKAGENAGFRGYSGALTGLTWDEPTLDRFIADPRSVSPGTTMIYPPVADGTIRKKIIAFLKTLAPT